MTLQTVLLLAIVAVQPTAPFNPVRKINVGGRTRSYVIHLPPQYDLQQPTPVVLVFHGTSADAHSISRFSGLNSQADKGGFVTVYPNGTKLGNTLLAWNSGGITRRQLVNCPDDVKFVRRLLDDLATVVNVDPKRVYATGHSNGAMMCYRLAVELSDRIAAIAPVGGTMAVDLAPLQHPVSVIHFHGTLDTSVPWSGPNRGSPQFLLFTSVEKTVGNWTKANGCPPSPVVENMPDNADDGTTVVRRRCGAGKSGAEFVLYTIAGGGHTWPGKESTVASLGKSTLDISANDLMWEFFQKHPMK